MTSAGLLTVRANLDQGSLVNIEVELRRPQVSQLFIGQRPDAVLKKVPYLYSLCSHAQQAAAQAAMAAAAGLQPNSVDNASTWKEMLHENLWRLLLDWPPALGLPPAKAAFIAWRSLRHSADCANATQKLLAETMHGLADQCLKRMGDPIHDVARAPVRLAPDEWLAYWQGHSTDLPAMLAPVSVRSAYLARIAEVEAATMALATGAPYPIAAVGNDGWAVAQTLTARGVLTHAVHLADERVAAYRVWAPTDGFFADAGALSRLLAGRQFASASAAAAAARQALEQAVLALDPCLPFFMELSDA